MQGCAWRQRGGGVWSCSLCQQLAQDTESALLIKSVLCRQRCQCGSRGERAKSLRSQKVQAHWEVQFLAATRTYSGVLPPNTVARCVPGAHGIPRIRRLSCRALVQEVPLRRQVQCTFRPPQNPCQPGSRRDLARIVIIKLARCPLQIEPFPRPNFRKEKDDLPLPHSNSEPIARLKRPGYRLAWR